MMEEHITYQESGVLITVVVINFKGDKCMNKLLRVTGGAILTGVISVGSFNMVSNVLANNYTDTNFGFSYSGDGSDLTTSMRQKQDSSATYVFNNAKNSYNISVTVHGEKSYSSCPDPNSHGYWSGRYTVKTGNRKYITTSMYPTYKYAFLSMATTDESAHYISGKWSPDNCSGY